MLNNVEIPWRRKRHVKIEYDKNFYADKNLRGGWGGSFTTGMNSLVQEENTALVRKRKIF